MDSATFVHIYNIMLLRIDNSEAHTYSFWLQELLYSNFHAPHTELTFTMATCMSPVKTSKSSYISYTSMDSRSSNHVYHGTVILRNICTTTSWQWLYSLWLLTSYWLSQQQLWNRVPLDNTASSTSKQEHFFIHGECIINQWHTLYFDLSSTVKFHCIVFQIHIVKCLTQINKQILLQGIYYNVHSNVLKTIIEHFCFVCHLSSCCWETPCRYLFI